MNMPVNRPVHPPMQSPGAVRAPAPAAAPAPVYYNLVSKMIKLKVHKMPAFYTQKNAFSTNLLWDAGVLKQKCKTTRNTISNCKEIQNFCPSYI